MENIRIYPFELGLKPITDEYALVSHRERYVVYRNSLTKLKRLPFSYTFYGKIRGFNLAFIPASYTANERFNTKSKDYPTPIELWGEFNKTIDYTQKGTEYKITVFSVSYSFYIKYIFKYIKKNILDVSQWFKVDRDAVILEFYRYLNTSTLIGARIGISVLSAYFQPEIIFQFIEDSLNVRNHTINIVDPMAGWGDRYIGSAAFASIYSNINVNYLGLDINTNLEYGYSKLYLDIPKLINRNISFNADYKICDSIEYLSELIENGHSLFTSGIFSPNGSISSGSLDIIFTSPPFYSLESTIGSDYSNYNEWDREWFSLFLEKCMILVNRGAILGLHALNTKNIPMVNSIRRVFSSREYIHRTVCIKELINKRWRSYRYSPVIHMIRKRY